LSVHYEMQPEQICHIAETIIMNNLGPIYAFTDNLKSLSFY